MAMLLTPLQARIVGVLVEKQHTVPDTYPLSLNALVTGCNQKNARDPVMEATEGEVRAALDELRQRLLVIESSGARVTRYSHNLGRVLKVPAQAEALLATLMLRGAQTASELRIASERLHRFADTGSVEVFLEELAARPADHGGALALKLPRRPGEREARWAHLLCGAPPAGAASADPVPATQPAGLAAEVSALRAEVEALRAEVAALRARLPDLAGA
ncbi:MAG: YceH family protein [Betaproteobacteria bacterium]